MSLSAGLRDLIVRIKSSGARAILCTPSVIGEKTAGANKLDAMLDEYSGISRRVGRKADVPLIDLRRAFMDYLEAHNKSNLAQGVLTKLTCAMERSAIAVRCSALLGEGFTSLYCLKLQTL